jgi:hypothetical protein
MRNFILVFLILPFWGANLHALNDFRAGTIVKHNGDTVHGLINYQPDYNLCQVCEFKTTKKEPLQLLYAWDIKTYQFDHERRKFVSDSVSYEEFTEKQMFLEVILEGKLNLYHIVEKNLIDRFFIKKPGQPKISYIPFRRYYEKIRYDHGFNVYEKIETHNTTNHIDTLKKFMSDRPDIFPTIEKIDEPNQSNLKKLFNLYVGSLNNNAQNFTYIKADSKFNFLVTPGAYYCFNRSGVYALTNMYGGAIVSFGVLKSNEHWYFKTGILLSKNAHYDSSNSDTNYFYKIPFQVEYCGSKKLIQPVIAYGYNYNSIYGFPTLSLTTGMNINLSKKIAINISPEFDFLALSFPPLVPTDFLSYNLFAGIQIKL